MKYLALAFVAVSSLVFMGCPKNPDPVSEATKLSDCTVTPELSDTQKTALDTAETAWDTTNKDKSGEEYTSAKLSLRGEINRIADLKEDQKNALYGCLDAKKKEGTTADDGSDS